MMKYLILFLISFNLYGACGTNTIAEISSCTLENKAGAIISSISSTAYWTSTGTGEGFYDGLEVRGFKKSTIKSAYVQWKVSEVGKKLGDCSLETGMIKDLCEGYKALEK